MVPETNVELLLLLSRGECRNNPEFIIVIQFSCYINTNPVQFILHKIKVNSSIRKKFILFLLQEIKAIVVRLSSYHSCHCCRVAGEHIL